MHLQVSSGNGIWRGLSPRVRGIPVSVADPPTYEMELLLSD